VAANQVRTWAADQLSGVSLRQRRHELGLTQVELARALGVSSNTVARWERGALRIAYPERVNATIEVLMRTESSRAPSRPREQPHNLPTAFTRFFGRELEIRQLAQLLDSSRLITLVGAAGIGKTRLALEVGTSVVRSFRDGVWLVELASTKDPQAVVQSVAATLGVTDEFDRPLVSTLECATQERHALLILDNCEHLRLHVSTMVTRWLRAAQELHIMCTTREPLGVPGETVWHLAPLATVRGNADADTASESAQLFADRARAANRHFELAASNRHTVERICDRLEGLPLAIELAAATAYFLTPQELLETMSPDKQAVVSTLRGARWQQPMADAIQRSVDVLTTDERQLFGCLAVFSSGFSMEAAEAVWGGPVLHLLRSLVSKSLVIAEPASTDSMRYRLLEPLREFATRLLETSGELNQRRREHARFFAGQARKANLALSSEAGGRSWQDLNADRDNLLLALRWFEHAHERVDAELVATALAEVSRVRGHLTEARGLLARVRTRADLQESTPGVLLLEGQLAFFQGDFTTARHLLHETVNCTRQQAFWPGLARALVRLSYLERATGNFDTARCLVHEAVETSTRYDADEAFVASLQAPQALIDLDEMRIDSARTLTERCLPLLRGGKFIRVEAEALLVLAVAASSRQQQRLAIQLLEASLARWQIGDRWGSARTLVELGRAYFAVPDMTAASAHIARSLQVCRELGDPWCAAAAIEASAAVAARSHRREASLRLLVAAARVRETTGLVQSPREHAWLCEQIGKELHARSSGSCRN
jgi:predicted ATPase/DNA-binding XRE family transcriptional regulator